MNEPEEKEGRDFSEFARDRPTQPESGTGGRILRGCAIAVGIAFLLLVFVVGACFIGLR